MEAGGEDGGTKKETFRGRRQQFNKRKRETKRQRQREIPKGEEMEV